jgi:hypothetical protein
LTNVPILEQQHCSDPKAYQTTQGGACSAIGRLLIARKELYQRSRTIIKQTIPNAHLNLFYLPSFPPEDCIIRLNPNNPTNVIFLRVTI